MVGFAEEEASADGVFAEANVSAKNESSAALASPTSFIDGCSADDESPAASSPDGGLTEVACSVAGSTGVQDPSKVPLAQELGSTIIGSISGVSKAMFCKDGNAAKVGRIRFDSLLHVVVFGK